MTYSTLGNLTTHRRGTGILFLGTILVLALRVQSIWAVERVIEMNRDTERTPLLSRIRAELEIAGFRVLETSDGPITDETVTDRKKNHFALLFVSADRDAIVVSYVTGDGGVNRLEVPIPLDNEEKQVTALHIAEVLRVAYPASPTPLTPMPDGPSTTPGTSRHRLLLSYLNVSLYWADPAWSPGWGISSGVAIRLARNVFVGVNGMIPLRPVFIAIPEGEMNLTAGSVGIGAATVGRTDPIAPVFRIAYRLWFVRGHADAGAGYRATTPSPRITIGPFAFAGVAFRIADEFGLEVGGCISIVHAPLIFEAAQRPIATFGRPLMGISLGPFFYPKDKDDDE